MILPIKATTTIAKGWDEPSFRDGFFFLPLLKNEPLLSKVKLENEPKTGRVLRTLYITGQLRAYLSLPVVCGGNRAVFQNQARTDDVQGVDECKKECTGVEAMRFSDPAKRNNRRPPSGGWP